MIPVCSQPLNGAGFLYYDRRHVILHKSYRLNPIFSQGGDTPRPRFMISILFGGILPETGIAYMHAVGRVRAAPACF